MNILDPRVLKVVTRWCESGRVWCIWFGTPCSRWSVARTTGMPRAPADVGGLKCARVTCQLIRLCMSRNIRYVVENPRSSRLWTWSPFAALLRRSKAVTAVFPMCHYGTPYQKFTRLSGTLFGLESLNALCTCCVPHEQLQGLAKFCEPSGKTYSVWKTSLAGKYPPGLCRALAQLLAASAPANAFRAYAEAPISRCWRNDLGAAVAAPPSHLAPPGCPKRFRCEWDDAIGFSMAGPSRQKRAAALAALGRRVAPHC